MKALVTGGGGFLGRSIVRMLLQRGAHVSFVARSQYPEVAAWGTRPIQGDLADPAVADFAVAQQDAVFHVAAKAGIWGSPDDYHRSNVVATQNLLEACRNHGVRYFIYTSTPSVTFDGHDHHNAGPDLPYATNFVSDYARTKCVAEKAVLSSTHLRTLALRPHLIWGPGDPHIFPGVIRRQMQGKLAQVGDGTNVIDLTYVDNAAASHIKALDALMQNVPISGKAFFISDGEPVQMWPFINELFSALDLPPVTKKVSAGVAYAAGGALEKIYRLFGKTDDPAMTRFAALQATTSHYYDMAPARTAFGYAPIITRPEAWNLTINDLRWRGLCGRPPMPPPGSGPMGPMGHHHSGAMPPPGREGFQTGPQVPDHSYAPEPFHGSGMPQPGHPQYGDD
ncbi:MAG: NAD-dependent epimerase/dehydratase family protein [Planctomycetota bacterium]|jgi:nucleoside-diphosphate-sugar epimerase